MILTYEVKFERSTKNKFILRDVRYDPLFSHCGIPDMAHYSADSQLFEMRHKPVGQPNIYHHTEPLNSFQFDDFYFPINSKEVMNKYLMSLFKPNYVLD